MGGSGGSEMGRKKRGGGKEYRGGRWVEGG